MRLEQQQPQAPPEPEPESATELQPQHVQVEGEPFYRQVEIIDLARRVVIEEEQAQYP